MSKKSPILSNKQGALSILLIGAANRFELATFLLQAGDFFDREVSLVSIERSNRVPIATLARIEQVQHDFASIEFRDELSRIFRVESFDLVLPLMDGAIQAVVELGLPSPANIHSISCLNKRNLKETAKSLGIPVPQFVEIGPAHIRPVFGNGGKGIRVVQQAELIGEELKTQSLVEEILQGPEFSFDVYAFLDGDFQVSARERIKVVGGEVQHTRTRRPSQLEIEMIGKLLDAIPLRGPLNFQFRGEPLHLLEINPRFGGGATASIHSGWSGPKWLMAEYLLREPSRIEIEPVTEVEVLRAWRDFVWR